MDTTGYSFSQSQSNLINANLDKNAADVNAQMAKLEQQAMDDALWRMAQNNIMAKMKGLNTLAKSANDMS